MIKQIKLKLTAESRCKIIEIWTSINIYEILTFTVQRAWEISYMQLCILILFIFEVLKLSPIHIWKTLHIFHSKVKAFTTEPLPYLLQAVTKISTLYNFMTIMYKPICRGNFKQWNWVSAWHYKGETSLWGTSDISCDESIRHSQFNQKVERGEGSDVNALCSTYKWKNSYTLWTNTNL